MPAIDKPILVKPGEGKKIIVGDSQLFLKLFSEATANKLSITEYNLSPKFPGPPAHKHKVFEHAWYVLSGSLTIQLENEISVLSQGSFIFIPRMTVHAFSNPYDVFVQLLVIDMPGGFENYYEDLQTAFGDGGAVDQDIMRGIQLKYDTYPPDYIF